MEYYDDGWVDIELVRAERKNPLLEGVARVHKLSNGDIFTLITLNLILELENGLFFELKEIEIQLGEGFEGLTHTTYQRTGKYFTADEINAMSL